MGFDLKGDEQNGMEHALGQAEDDSTTSVGDLSGEIEFFRLRSGQDVSSLLEAKDTAYSNIHY